MALARYLTGQGATVLFTSEASRDAPDDDVQFFATAWINLEYGPDGRTISVSKFRGSNFIEGPHSMRIARGGVRIAPRLLPCSMSGSSWWSHSFGYPRASTSISREDRARDPSRSSPAPPALGRRRSVCNS